MTGDETVHAALTRFRVIAYVVGSLLVLLTIGVVIQVAGGGKALVAIVGPVHGFLYIGYLLLGYDLLRRVRWPIWRMLLIALAGVVPGLTFVVERWVSRQLTDRPAPARPA
jgi:integral membrane protein